MPEEVLVEAENAAHERLEIWVIWHRVEAQELGRDLQSEVRSCLSIEQDVESLTVTRLNTQSDKHASDSVRNFHVILIGAEPAVLCQLEPDELLDAELGGREDPKAGMLAAWPTFHLSVMWVGESVSESEKRKLVQTSLLDGLEVYHKGLKVSVGGSRCRLVEW